MRNLIIFSLLMAMSVLAATNATAEYGEWERLYGLGGSPGMTGASIIALGVGDLENLYTVGINQTSGLAFDTAWKSDDGGVHWDSIYTVSLEVITGCEMLDLFDLFLATDSAAPDKAVFAGIKIDEECIEQHEFPGCLFLCMAQIHGRMKYTDDGGETLHEATINAPTFLNMVMRIQMINENVGYAIGAPNVVWKTTDGGKTWEDGNAPGNLMTFYNDVHFINEEVGFLVSGVPEDDEKLDPSGIDDPQELMQWLIHRQRMVNDPLYRWQVREEQDKNGDAKMTGGKVYRTRDGGETWDLVLEDYYDGYVSITMVNENEAWLIGEPHIPDAYLFSLYHTTDGGDTWEDVTDRMPAQVTAGNRYKLYRSMFSGNGQTGFVAGAAQNFVSYSGLLLYTEDGGETWREDTSYTEEIRSVLVDFKWANNHVLFGGGMDIVIGKYTQANAAPVADAGDDQSIASSMQVQLDGSGSEDPDGDTLSFIWEQIEGETVELSGADTAAPTFVAEQLGELVFALTVSDSSEEDVDQVTITVSEDGDGDDDDDNGDDDSDDDDDDDDDDGCGC